jgi:phosphoribosylaminoimidazolecarboxamide formyltransferase/IMP cyclohydrolase
VRVILSAAKDPLLVPPPETAHALSLRYGINPHQTPARVLANGGLPFQVLNGAPGYINLLDALNGWQLVRELRQVLGLPAAASFKHVSPAGAAVGLPLSETLRQAYFVGPDSELTPLANAYARARGADRVCSYGDWVALSDPVDLPTAKLLRREVSDGVIAPAYEPDALEILKAKKGGRYTVLQVDPSYEPPELETRQVFGVTFEQRHNAVVPGLEHLTNVVTRRQLPDHARRDLLIGLITVKYTQSNSVCLVADGQVIGNGAGQQSRIHCTRLASDKADTWRLRQHPATLALEFRKGLDRVDRDNAIDQFLRDDLTPAEEAVWRTCFSSLPRRLSHAEKRAYLDSPHAIALASDAFIPFRDNIDRAHASGVEFVVQPGGAQRDPDVIAACDEYNMAMAFSGLRLFHH